MPFLSHGNMNMMITYFYMGILLSVYRNTNVVKKLVDNIEKGIYHIKHIGKERKVCERLEMPDMTRAEAWELLTEYNQDEFHLQQCTDSREYDALFCKRTRIWRRGRILGNCRPFT